MKNNTKSFIISIDIGKKGVICINKNTASDFELYKIPMIKTELDYRALYEILEPYEAGRGIVIFEKLGVIFGTSKQTAFSMGHQSGAVEMACVALSIPFQKVSAKIWQKEMFQGIAEISKPSKTGKTQTRDTKAMALLVIKQLYPKLKLTFGKQTKPDDNLIDAVLINEYAKRKL